MEDASHSGTLDIPKGRICSSDHLDTDTDSFCRGAQYAFIILISFNMEKGLIPSLVFMKTLSKEDDADINVHVKSQGGVFMTLIVFG